MPPTHSLSDYDYILPEELIAQTPVEPRDHSRLLVYERATGEILHTHFHQIGRHLHPGTRLVLNDTRVEQCRLLFHEGRSEVFILEEDPAASRIKALVRPGKRFRAGDSHELAPGLRLTVEEVMEDGRRVIHLHTPLTDPAWSEFRHTPFPPYIKADETLADRYQTVYSNQAGSKAAPTAGLHFTPHLLDGLRAQGVGTSVVTLHVGLGTFAPVKEEDITHHRMHSEWFAVTGTSLSEIGSAPHRTAVGTTSLRVLESLRDLKATAGTGGHASGETDIFITPGYRFRHTESLITNFHLPKSTLLMLVAAMTGLEEMHRIYAVAIREKYRFYSFGDAMLIL